MPRELEYVIHEKKEKGHKRNKDNSQEKVRPYGRKIFLNVIILKTIFGSFKIEHDFVNPVSMPREVERPMRK